MEGEEILMEMKQLISLFSIAYFLVSCNNQESNETTHKDTIAEVRSGSQESTAHNSLQTEMKRVSSATNCIVDSADLSLPLGNNQVLNQVVNGLVGFRLLCKIPELEKFKCGTEPLNYHQIPEFQGIKCIIIPYTCGDSEFYYLITFKGDKYMAELLISKVQEMEIGDEMGLEYITTNITQDHTIELSYSRATGNFDSREEFKKETYQIQEDGTIVLKGI